MYDLIIIGGGPAAICAGIYAARKKIKVLLLTKEFGGQMVLSPKVDNYLGIPDLTGMDLLKKFTEHLKKFEVEIQEGETVKEISVIPAQACLSGRQAGIQISFEISTNKSSYQTKSVLIATGKSPRRLDVPGAKEFEGKGIVYCATCDAPLFANKIVAVVGSGDSAIYIATDLLKYANKIYILDKYPEFKGENLALVSEIKKNPKIEIITNAIVKEIRGEKFVTELIYERMESIEELKVDGIFVAIGSRPNSNFVENIVQLNEKREIIIDYKNNQTSTPGIFAAGDVTNIIEKQIIIAAAEGAKAALNAYNYIKNN